MVNLLGFEFKKFKEVKLWVLLMMFPIVLIASLGIYSTVTQDGIRSREMNTANSLNADLNWQIGLYQRQRMGHYGDYNPEVETSLNTEEQEILTLLQDAERARFNYSADAYNEEWQSMNEAKQQIWNNLIQLRDTGVEIRAVESETLEMDKAHIDWLVDNEVDYVTPNQTSESLFLLNNSLSILFSLPMMFILLFFFAVPVFEETLESRFNFTKVLPVSLNKIFATKLVLFFIILCGYIASAIMTIGVIHLIFDDISWQTQLNYPIYSQSLFGDIMKPLGEILLWRIIFFVFVSVSLVLSVYIVSAFVSTMLFNTLMIGFITIISTIIIQSNVANYQLWNIFAWLDSYSFIQLHPTLSLILVVFILMALIVILYFVSSHVTKWVSRRHGAKNLKGINRLKHNFLLKHELLQFKRDKSLFYALCGLVLMGSLMGATAYQKHQNHLNHVEENLEIEIARIGEMIENPEERLIELYDRVNNAATLDEAQRYQSQIDSLNNSFTELESEYNELQSILDGNFDILIDREANEMEGDFLFVRSQEAETTTGTIPLSNSIFMPNASINYHLNQWKIENNIDFIPPGGPYSTKLVPGFEVSPRSGDNEPPMAIDYQIFQNYVDARAEEHDYLSGLNLSTNIINDYMYLVIWLIIIVFFSINYVKEWDGYKTIRFAKVQPIQFRKLFSAKVLSSQITGFSMLLVGFLVIIVIGTLLNGFGQIDFPFVRYIAKSIGDSAPEGRYIQISQVNQYFTIIPLWRYLLEGFGLLALATAFLIQMTQLFAVFIKRRWLVVVSTIVLIAVFTGLCYLYPQAWMQWLPFYYFNIPDILTGSTAIDYDLQIMNVYSGMFILLVYNILLICISQLLVRKDESRDIS